MSAKWRILLALAALFTGAPSDALAGASTGASALPHAGPSIRVVVDPRIELMSIVFRLAGSPEYVLGALDPYTKDVDRYFAAFKNHPVVARARELRKRRGISHNAPMALAVNLTALPELAERVPLDPIPQGVDARWTPTDARSFLADLRAFVRDADVPRFIAAHEALYRTSADRLDAMVRDARIGEWLDSFFGAHDGRRLTIAIGMLNGGGNYGASAYARSASGSAARPALEEMFAILGASRPDSNGVPLFPKDEAPTIVHEFCHAYVDPIVAAHKDDFASPAGKLYALVEADMRALAYGSTTIMVVESLVRAATVRYVATTGGEEAGARQGAYERGVGFAWVPRLADLFAEYERQRTALPSLEPFVPRVVAFFDDYDRTAAADLASARAEARTRQEAPPPADAPKVLGTVPANNADGIDAAAVSAIVITFDRPMNGGFAVVAVPGAATPLPTSHPEFDAEKRVLTIRCSLRPGVSYGMQLNSAEYNVMADEKGHQLPPYVLRFTTRK